MRLLFFILFTNALFSQVKLRGFVKDTLQNPLAYANIIAKPNGSIKDMVFTLSDDIGYYKLNLKRGKTYFLEISFMGYETIKDTITISKKTIKHYYLEEASNLLNAVTLDLPVVVKEDTIQYKIERFTNGKERKLKNILKKLPGMEVSRKGEVTVLGKKVAEILVDNKPFFGSGTKLAVENIPADAVKSVQALDNYNEVGFLKKVSKSGKMVLNIKLKKDKKRFFFGDIEARKGKQKLYDTQANVYYYSKKLQINSITNSNNTNKVVLSYGQLSSLIQPNYNSVFENINSDFSTFNMLSSSDNNITNSKQHFGTLDLKGDISDNIRSSGYIIYSNKTNQSLTERTVDYFDYIEKSNSTFDEKTKFSIANISFNYRPNSDEVWEFKTKLNNTNSTTGNYIDTRFENFSTKINNSRTNNSKTISQSIEFHQDNGNHIISALAYYNYDQNNPLAKWSYSKALLTGSEITQQKQIKNYSFNTIFKDFWMINKNNHFYATIGNSYKESFFYSDNNITAKNNVKYTFHDFSIGPKYRVRLGRTSIKLGADYHHYTWRVNSTKKQKSLVFPNFKLQTKFTSSKELSLSYAMNSSMASVANLARNPVYTSYRSMFIGDSDVENELYHNCYLSYSRNNMYRGLNIGLSLFYLKKDKGYSNSIKRNNYTSINKFTLVDNLSENLLLRTRFSKKIKRIKYQLTINASNNKYLSLFEKDIIKNESQNIDYNISLNSTKINPSFSVGFNQSYSFNKNSKVLSITKKTAPSFEIEYIFFKNFVAQFDYSYNDFSNNVDLNQKNTYQSANFDLMYHKEDSPWTFDCKMTNIFNTKFKQRSTFSSVLISDIRNYVMPRIILVGVIYKL